MNPDLRVDPEQRCISLRVYHDYLAFLPMKSGSTAFEEEEAGGGGGNISSNASTTKVEG